MDLSIFPLSKLPPEIRLMIWEHIWPETRVVEVAIRDETFTEHSLCLHMRVTGALSSFLRQDFHYRHFQDPPLETSPDPVALHICRESRAHTLEKYIAMKHSRMGCGSFYFNPNRDVFWFSEHCDDLDVLRGHYREPCDKIERVLVGELECNMRGPEDHSEDFVEHVPGLGLLTVGMDSEGFGIWAGLSTLEGIDHDHEMIAKDKMEMDSKEVGGFPWAVQYMIRDGRILCEWVKDNCDGRSEIVLNSTIIS